MKYSMPVVMAYFKECGLPKPQTEYIFLPGQRKFRFDFAWPYYPGVEDGGVALECEGGVWTRGAHGRGTGIARDIEKYNLATLAGWKVLRCTPDNLCMLETVNMVKKALGME